MVIVSVNSKLKTNNQREYRLQFKNLTVVCAYALFHFGGRVFLNKGNNKITELRTILQRESQSS